MAAKGGFVPWLMFLVCVLLQGGCTCSSAPMPNVDQGLVACRTRSDRSEPAARDAPEVETISAGTIPGVFALTSAGEGGYVMNLAALPGRAGVEPRIALQVRSDGGGDGILGAGSSLVGVSAITRCPSHLTDGEIRAVRYDASDQLCLDHQRLVPVRRGPGTIEFRTFPDTQVKVMGHYPPGAEAPAEAEFFEAIDRAGLVVEYGRGDGGKPLALGGVPRAWLATKVHDGRGNAMTYAYCAAEAEAGYTAETALDEIRYTSFEGSPALAPSRAVRFVYETKGPAEVRLPHAGGMALQSSLRLEEIQMLGPGDALVWRYAFSYDVNPATHRTLLSQVEACASDGVCKPPTRFRYSRGGTGFARVPTGIAKPTSTLASPMLLDLDADGRDDLLVPDADPALSTPGNPITVWRVGRNRGERGTPPYISSMALGFVEDWPTVADPQVPADPSGIQPELGTAIDYDHDGRTDILLHDVYGAAVTWQVLLTQPDRTFRLHDTGIRRPFPLRSRPLPPALAGGGSSAHLADVDGDRVPDLIQCQDHGETPAGDPAKPVWAVHRWKPAREGAGAGFAPVGEPIERLAGFDCATQLHTVDLDADGKVDLVVTEMLTFGDGSQVPASSYYALSRGRDGHWEAVDTELPVVPPGGRVMFLDVNGDGLPDAVASGFGDHALRTYLNGGKTFGAPPRYSLGAPGLVEQDRWFRLAVPLDYNGDGRQDLLLPAMPGILPGASEALPAWAVLEATSTEPDATFALVDPKIPFEVEVAEALTPADPRAPRVGDVNGDGAQDVVMVAGGEVTIFQSLAADQDLLIAVADGMNPHEPADAAFTPTVSVSYGHLTDAAIAEDLLPGDSALGDAPYVSRADAGNGCAYPRSCAVGPRRVVTGYALDNGAGRPRRFAVRYRDGRYHRLGRGFLGFGERIVEDLDTGATTTERYDNVTYDNALGVFPFAGQMQQQWRVAPGLPGQPEPDRIEMEFVDVKRTLVPTSEGASYFTLATERRVRRAQGLLRGSVEDYAEQTERGEGAPLLQDTTAKVTDFDAFGNVLAEEVSTQGVDLRWTVERTYQNDTERWVLGKLETQRECSTAAGMSRCRALSRTHTLYGEVERETLGSDEGIADTTLHVVYSRDDFGNIEEVTAEDGHGHRRVSSTTYDAEGLFPETHVNAEGHTTIVGFDAELGALTTLTDPNGLVTAWKHDGFGRVGQVTRPDGSETRIALSRTKDGVRQRSTTTGGEDETVELDRLGRPIRRLWHGPSPTRGGGEPPRLMQEIVYDELGEHVARRSLPVREDVAARDVLYDVYEYDALGREVRHTTPWNAVTETVYDGLRTTVTEPGAHLTVIEQDALGRTVSITDAARGVTRYEYGPFGTLYSVTDPGGAVTRTTRDAFGRVRQLDAPDRGTTRLVHDGFGDLLSETDALERVSTFEVDGLGRTTSRSDRHGAARRTTTWAWDTAKNGIGQLHEVTSPDGRKTYEYNGRGLVETITLAVEGERDVLQARLDYDDFGRVETLGYPTPPGAAPFAVAQERDAYGHVLAVRDATTRLAYWRLTDVDNAGRFKSEAFGNDVLTERSYYADKQRLESFLTRGPAGTVQDLTYAYDERLDLARRTDALQTRNPTERFRHDALHRLTCAYFSPIESAAAPCAQRFEYAENGNLTFKSDVGALAYDDPIHPHAVTDAGAVALDHDAVGNQIRRPDGAAVRFTPFDLPEQISLGARVVTFGYDGDEQRIRKTTPTEETLYFGDLYERVTHAASATTEHRYYVRSPERAVAVVTRGGAEPGTRYLHVDHLGSIDALTDEGGAVVEQRSYDAFGQRRNPVWGEPAPAPLASGTTLGFTGHEGEDDLGLVNMKGRLFDPWLGRFLTPDPIVARPYFGQSWNPYGYVLNNPLAHVDPSGFDPDARDGSNLTDLPGGWGLHFIGPTQAGPPPPPTGPGGSGPKGPKGPAPVEGPREASEVGAATSPFDVSTTGTGAGYVPQPVTLSPIDGAPPRPVALEGGAREPAWTGDKLNPVSVEGRLGRALLGTEKPVEPWTPPGAVALTRAGMHLIPGLGSALVLGDPDASPLEKVLAVSTDVLSVAGVGVVLKAGRAGVIAREGAHAATFNPTRARHIFRDAVGHVNPTSAGSQARFTRLFEQVATTPANLRTDAVGAELITQDAANAGVQAFTWTAKSGNQVWVTVRNGEIQNAGINLFGAAR